MCEGGGEREGIDGHVIQFGCLDVLSYRGHFCFQASVSVKRLRRFLKNEELDPTTVLRRPEHARGEGTQMSKHTDGQTHRLTNTQTDKHTD